MTPAPALVPAPTFTDHAVLQRNRPIAVWGTDLPGQSVEVHLRGATSPAPHASAAGVAGPDGGWRVHLPPQPAGGPWVLELRGSRIIRCTDVLIGEVWLASGQSNMEWSIDASADPARARSEAAERPQLRFFVVPRQAAVEAPASTVRATWRPVSPEAGDGVSAVAFNFARRLHDELGVPVGVLQAAWGGTRIEAWIGRETARSVCDLEAELPRFLRTPEEIAALLPAYERERAAWIARHLPAEPANRGLEWGWARADFDDSSWGELRVGATWQSQGWKFNGTGWYRRTVDLPPEWAGSDLVAHLGACDDADHAYANGELIGHTPRERLDSHAVLRAYPIPGRLTAGGRLVLAVRVFDHGGGGGMVGPAAGMRLEPAQPGAGGPASVPLEGRWRARPEQEIHDVSPSVFTSLPRSPVLVQPEQAPSALFQGMVAPLVPHTLRGAIWYQGESNTAQAARYDSLQVALVRDWRTRWGQGTFPFHWVQLTSFRGGPGWPHLREAQSRASAEPGTGMAVILDVGAADDIHPSDKRTVGERLARLALRQDYGRSDVVAAGPTLAAVDIREGQALVTYQPGTARGLRTTDGRAPTGFELAGADGRFQPAEATIDGESVRVQAGAVGAPCALRYAFAEVPAVNLVNDEGLPAAPFRTDGL